MAGADLGSTHPTRLRRALADADAGVRGPRLDERLPSEQVPELHEHEREEEQIEERQDDGQLGPAERAFRLDLQLDKELEDTFPASDALKITRRQLNKPKERIDGRHVP